MARLPTLKPRLQVIKTKPAQSTAQPQPKRWGSGRGGRPWRRLKEKIHTRDHWTCLHCGITTMKLELDHIINVAQGGTDDESNLQSLCPECHKVKSQKESHGGMSVFGRK
ncbi:HNH endonuclease [Acinetobacter lwoffii]|uniref:HNH endonuclease n=1 Tax=Acinetobacter lwoffii TaxID=28090 RepID=UPI0020982EA5|nr:HNH endonuclease [Acinetobacter lwoffii]MCO8071880.1 HNH endonuclease [Acinetobacter lwoffii]